MPRAFLAAGHYMRSKRQLSITNNDRNQVCFRKSRILGALEESTAPRRTGWLIFVTITWAASGHHSLEPVPNLHDAGPQTLAGAFSGEWRFARVWVELPDLEHHLFKRRDGSFG